MAKSIAKEPKCNYWTFRLWKTATPWKPAASETRQGEKKGHSRERAAFVPIQLGYCAVSGKATLLRPEDVEIVAVTLTLPAVVGNV